jgi:hypothetical protein
MRNALPRVDETGVDVDDALGVPVPVVADIPVPRDDLAPRNEWVAWAPVSAGEAVGAVATLIARAICLSSSYGQAKSGQTETTRHRDGSCEPRNSVHGWFLS